MSRLTYLVAVDGSEWSQRAAQRAFYMAEQCNAKIRLVTVINYPTVQPVVMEGIVVPPIDRESEQRYAEDKVLRPLVDSLPSSKLEVTTKVLWGEPVEEICNEIKSSHVHLVFVGRHGRSRIVDILMGSVANKLAHTVGIPIVLVP